jgi:ABC-type glutathione transport system ATPase component
VALLKVDNLSVTVAGTKLVDDVSFAIGKGQRLALMGETGSGKSLVIGAILGLLPKESVVTGTMSFDDQPMPMDDTGRAALRGKRIGVILDRRGLGLAPLKTVRTQLEDALTRAAREGDKAAQLIDLLADTGLAGTTADRYPDALSIGERRRVLLAMALAAKPDLLIADDPAEGLDLIDQRRTLDLILKHCTEREMSLLVAAHDLKTLAMLSTKVVVLREGKIAEAGEKQDVFGHPKAPFTRAVLSAGRHRARTLMRTPIGGPLIDVRDVSRSFRRGPPLLSAEPPVVAVDGASLSIRLGESIAVIGPSGSGKSTLLRIIAGLERATSGEIELESMVYHGTDLPRVLRHDIAFVFPNPARAFNPRHTIGESIAEPLQLEMQKSVDELGARIVEVVNAVGLPADVLTRLPREFTLAQLQRLAIARALVARPRLIVLDDPIAPLDVAARGEVLVMLNRLRADFGLSFLIAAHDLDIVRVVADRVLVMSKGRIVETSTPAQLLEKPQAPISQQLVAAQLPDVGIVPVF